jgi:phage-related tail fiber protein
MAKAFQGLGFISGTNAERLAHTVGVAEAGTQWFETDTSAVYVWSGSAWFQSIYSGLTPAGGDLTGTYPNPTLAHLAAQVAYFARSTAPTGWLKANGALVSRTAYSDLFAAIGTSYGAGDGSTTFALPDFRGEFLRSWADGSGTDSGRALHSFQNYDWKGFYQTNTGTNTYSYSHGPVYMGKSIYGSFTGNLFIGYWAAPAAALGTAWDGSEIRPRNRALLACIKY